MTPTQLEKKTIDENTLLIKHGYVEGGDPESNKLAIDAAREEQGKSPIYGNIGTTNEEISKATNDKNTPNGVTTGLLSNIKSIFQ